MAMAAVVLMACNQGEKPDLVKQDKKMLDKAGKGMIGLLGQDQETVDAKLIKLGFEKVDDKSSLPMHRALKARFPEMRMPAAEGDTTVSYYVYNSLTGEALDGGMLSVAIGSDEESKALRVAIADAKKLYVEFQVAFIDDACVYGVASFAAGYDVENIDYAYINFNSELYKQTMEKDKYGEWYGHVTNVSTLGFVGLVYLLAPVSAFDEDYIESCMSSIDFEEAGIMITDDKAEWETEFFARPDTSICLTVGTAIREIEPKNTIEYVYNAMWYDYSEKSAAEVNKKDDDAAIKWGIISFRDVDEYSY